MLLLLSKDGNIPLNGGQALYEEQVMLSFYQLVEAWKRWPKQDEEVDKILKKNMKIGVTEV